MGRTSAHAGLLPSGSAYVIEAPPDWNGILLSFSHPVPVAPHQPPWNDDPLVNYLVSRGYAVAGSANTIFWPLELAFNDQPALFDMAGRTLGSPRHNIALGLSIGGIIAAGAVQRHPELLSGALSVCGNLAGAIGCHNRELDVAFVLKTLLAADSPLQVAGIGDPFANLRAARSMLQQGQESPSGRARLALAAAVGNIPGWHDPLSDPPARSDFAAQQRNQFDWFKSVTVLVMFWAREQMERQAGGNPSWNTGVDYRLLLDASINCDEVVALYAQAGLDLDDDLDRLGSRPRIEADTAARGYLERHIVFSGDLGGVPVLTMHTDGDGLVTPDNERAYAEIVAHAGQSELLRQLYVHRAGHCTVTLAEAATALDVLLARVERGRWPDHDAETLNVAASRLGPEHNILPRGESTPPGFFAFQPRPFPRRYDVRDSYRLASAAGDGNAADASRS